ncbi:MAG: hypothetical protein ACTSRU_00740 [Candidatus Hodarchaeales archaeon]
MNKNGNNLERAAFWNEHTYKHIDVIVSSGNIRKMFFERCKELKLDPIKVAMKAGIKPTTFNSHYIMKAEPVCTKGLPQDKFIKMLEMVGFEIKVLIKMKPFNEVYVELKENGLITD